MAIDSPAASVFADEMVFDAPASPPLGMIFTVSVTAPAAVFVPVNLSTIVRVPAGTVYCAASAFAACSALKSGFEVTAMRPPMR